MQGRRASHFCLDLHVPDGPGPFAAAILVHGGGFDAGNRTMYITPIFKLLSDAGFAWFSIDYRMGPDFHLPDAIADVNSAIQWLKKNSGTYYVDPAKIALVGESAGGFLVAYAGTHETPKTRVQTVVDFYGPSDYRKLAIQRREHPEDFDMQSVNAHEAHGGGIIFLGADGLDAKGEKKLDAISPIFAVHKGMAPFLCIHGTSDRMVSYDQSTAFCQAIQKTGSECRMVPVPGGGHGMSSWEKAGKEEWKETTVSWLKKELKVSQ